ncbi:Uncharacterised protein [Mycobacteroides abscessus subsp. abscessus]|nr:Uncharacterised protein [Mycobacteroides abscessus subsp. abscessus]
MRRRVASARSCWGCLRGCSRLLDMMSKPSPKASIANASNYS